MAYRSNVRMTVKGRDMRPFFLREYADILRAVRRLADTDFGKENGMYGMALLSYHLMSFCWDIAPIRQIPSFTEDWAADIDDLLLEFGTKCSHFVTDEDMETCLSETETLGDSDRIRMFTGWMREKSVSLLEEFRSLMRKHYDNESLITDNGNLLQTLLEAICAVNIVLGSLPKEIKLPYGLDMTDWFYMKYGDAYGLFDSCGMGDFFAASEMKEFSSMARKLRKREKELKKFCDGVEALPGGKYGQDLYDIEHLARVCRVEDERLSLIHDLVRRQEKISYGGRYTTFSVNAVVDSIVNEIRWVPYGGITLKDGEDSSMWDAVINGMMMKWFEKNMAPELKKRKENMSDIMGRGFSPEDFMAGPFDDDDDDDDGNLRF